MKLIVGLGNPGIRYQFSRHNMGFLVLDQFASHHNISITLKSFDAYCGKAKMGDIPVFLAKPQTFMNVSGIAVKKLVDYYKIDLEDIIVVHDDLDLPFFSLRIKANGGHAGHKGLISLIEHLGSPDFIRVRLGIGKPLIKSMTEDYVLQPFTKDEMEELPYITKTGSDALTKIITSGIQAAMNQFNERASDEHNRIV